MKEYKMEDYNGIIKIKDEHGEHYTDEYVSWLESALKETKSQLELALTLKRSYESRIEREKDPTHYWEQMHDHGSYSDDEYDR